MKKHFPLAAMALAFAAISGTASAELRVGVVLSATGPAASLGIPEKNTFELLPKQIGGESVRWIVIDDWSSPAQAAKAAQQLVAENKVDVIIGSTTSPASMGMTKIAAKAETPMITMSASDQLINPSAEETKWIFKTPQSTLTMAKTIVDHMRKNGITTVSVLAFADGYGKDWLASFEKAAEGNPKLISKHTYDRNEVNLKAVTEKVMEGAPQAILVAGAGVPSIMPQIHLKDFRYAGAIYQTHGVANAEFLKLGGKNVWNTYLPVGPLLVADQLPDSHPSKAAALEYKSFYETKYGRYSTSTFGGHAWDAYKLLEATIPVAKKAAKPGSTEFRLALRDALENAKGVAGSHGIFNITKTDHLGFDANSGVIVKVENGFWKYQPN